MVEVFGAVVEAVKLRMVIIAAAQREDGERRREVFEIALHLIGCQVNPLSVTEPLQDVLHAFLLWLELPL